MVGKKGKEGPKKKKREGYMCGGEKKKDGKKWKKEEGNMDEKKSKEIREQ